MQTALISNALIIPGAEAVVYRCAEGLRALCLDEQDGQDGYRDCSRQASLLLDSPAEKRLLPEALRLDQIKMHLTRWSHRQRLLNYLIGGMNRELSDDTRKMGFDLAEADFADQDAADFSRARLLACPMPADADIQGALALAQEFPQCKALYIELETIKDTIAPVSSLLKNLVYREFDSDTAADELYRAMVESGVVAQAVKMVRQWRN